MNIKRILVFVFSMVMLVGCAPRANLYSAEDQAQTTQDNLVAESENYFVDNDCDWKDIEYVNWDNPKCVFRVWKGYKVCAEDGMTILTNESESVRMEFKASSRKYPDYTYKQELSALEEEIESIYFDVDIIDKNDYKQVYDNSGVSIEWSGKDPNLSGEEVYGHIMIIFSEGNEYYFALYAQEYDYHKEDVYFSHMYSSLDIG